MRWPTRFSFWALTLGAMIPDLEVLPFMAVSGDPYLTRGPMHSLLGALTWDAVVTVLLVYWLFPPALRWFRRRWPDPRLLRFAGQDLNEDPHDVPRLYASAAFGAFTHVVFDLPTHSRNPFLWPFRTDSLQVLPFAGDAWWNALMTIPWLTAFLVMIYLCWRR